MAIQGLSEAQCSVIKVAQIGDLVFIMNSAPSAQHDDEGSDRDSDEDGDRDEEEEETEEMDDDEEEDEEDEDAHAEADEEEVADDEGANEGVEHDLVDSEISAQDDNSNDSSGQAHNDQTSTTSTASIPVPPRMYVVSDLTKDDEGVVTSLKVTKLTYAHKLNTDSTGHAYHVYGKNVVHHHSSTCGDSGCVVATSITDVVGDQSLHLMLNPNGDTVRRLEESFRAANPHTSCIGGCTEGWLGSHQGLINMIKDYDTPVLSSGPMLPAFLQPPVCPVCVGEDLCKEQQKLQATLLNTSRSPEFGDCHDFLSNLNQRRRNELGYPFKQFDEREWGLLFDDMLSEDEEEEDDEDRWENFEEAMDPSSAPTQVNPISAATLASLPRQTRQEAINEESSSNAVCVICPDAIDDESILVKLPCGHAHFHEDCIIPWLSIQSDTCPTCRMKVPAVEAMGAKKEDTSFEDTAEARHGSDVVMSLI